MAKKIVGQLDALRKSLVKGHYRTVNGRRVFVKQYDNKRTRQPEEATPARAGVHSDIATPGNGLPETDFTQQWAADFPAREKRRLTRRPLPDASEADEYGSFSLDNLLTPETGKPFQRAWEAYNDGDTAELTDALDELEAAWGEFVSQYNADRPKAAHLPNTTTFQQPPWQLHAWAHMVPDWIFTARAKASNKQHMAKRHREAEGQALSHLLPDGTYPAGVPAADAEAHQWFEQQGVFVIAGKLDGYIPFREPKTGELTAVRQAFEDLQAAFGSLETANLWIGFWGKKYVAGKSMAECIDYNKHGQRGGVLRFGGERAGSVAHEYGHYLHNTKPDAFKRLESFFKSAGIGKRGQQETFTVDPAYYRSLEGQKYLNYLRAPEECIARLVDQYVADKLLEGMSNDDLYDITAKAEQSGDRDRTSAVSKVYIMADETQPRTGFYTIEQKTKLYPLLEEALKAGGLMKSLQALIRSLSGGKDGWVRGHYRHGKHGEAFVKQHRRNRGRLHPSRLPAEARFDTLQSNSGEPLLVRTFGTGGKLDGYQAFVVWNGAGKRVGSLGVVFSEELGAEGSQSRDIAAHVLETKTEPGHEGDGQYAFILQRLVSYYGVLYIPLDVEQSVLNDLDSLDPAQYTIEHYEPEQPKAGTLRFFDDEPGYLRVVRAMPTLFPDDEDSDLLKSVVKGHFRTVAGKRVWVKPYNSSREAHPEEPSGLRRHAELEDADVRATEGTAAEPGSNNRPVQRTGAGRKSAGTGRSTAGRKSGTGSSGGTRRGIITARAELLPAVDLTACPKPLQKALDPDQIEGVARAITALDHHGGFIMADGTGVGKTRQILAIAKTYHDRGLPVLIVAPAEVIKQDWKSGTYYGSYQEDGAAVGIIPTLLDGKKRRLKSNEVGITTYTALKRPDPNDLPDGTIVIFDEAHGLKNSTGGGASGTATWGCELARQAGAVVYASATPMDKAEHLPYLFRAGVCEGKNIAETLTALGLEYKQKIKVNKKTGELIDRSRWVIQKGVTKEQVAKRVMGLFDRMTANGTMLKREVSLEGLSVDLLGISVPAECREMLARIEERYTEESYNEDSGESESTMDPFKMAIMLQDQRRHLEPYKVAPAVELIKQELAEGRKVAVFCARVNASESAVETTDEKGNVLDKVTFAETEGTAKALSALLAKEGVLDVAELHGAATPTPASKKAAQDKFQGGDASVLITTVESGGTGINLDDRVGDAPRTLICLTSPFTAPGIAQMVGRVIRRTTASDVRVKFLFADEPVDRWNARIANDKLEMLGASVQGEIGDRIKLDSDLIDWLTDEDMPYQFYNPQTKVAKRGQDPDDAEDGDAGEKRTQKRSAAPKAASGGVAPTSSPAPQSGAGGGAGGASGGGAAPAPEAPAPAGGSVAVEKTTYTTKKGKSKPVYAFKMALTPEQKAEFKEVYGWTDSGTGQHMVGINAASTAFVERVTGQKLQKSVVGAFGDLLKSVLGGMR